MVTYTATVVSFIVALIISAVIIYLITKLFGETEGRVRHCSPPSWAR